MFDIQIHLYIQNMIKNYFIIKNLKKYEEAFFKTCGPYETSIR